MPDADPAPWRDPGPGPRLDRLLTTALDTAIDLPAQCREHDVVAAVAGVSIGGARAATAAGVADVRTEEPVGRDTFFLAGSITKAMTASMVALLASEGLLDLDDPVVRHVPAFRVADDGATATITVRHLLSHTAGFDGDIWPDLGDDHAAQGRLVASFDHLPQLFAPGAGFSYNNAGYAVLGHLVERLTRMPFEAALRVLIAAPCGASLTTDSSRVPEGARATGHVRGVAGWEPVAQVVGPACLAGAGARTWATIDDLLAFGELHLGRHGDATLGAAVARMRVPQIEVGDPNNGLTMALGVWLDDRWGTPVVFHDGGVSGQSAYLRILPERDTVLAVMCTGGVPQVFHRHVLARAAEALLGVRTPPAAAADPSLVLDAARYVGRYESTSMSITIEDAGSGLVAAIDWHGADGDESSGPIPLRPVDHRVLIGPLAGRDYVFVFPDGAGPSSHVLAGLRRANRLG